MEVAKYIAPGTAVTTLANMQQTEVGRAVLHALRIEAERRDKALRKNPRVNTEAMRDDVRHKLGEIDGLEWMERLVRAAQDAVSGKVAAKEE